MFPLFTFICGAQRIGSLTSRPDRVWIKAENGLVITWTKGISADADSSRISVYDKQGHSITNFEVLKLVPDAKSVSIYDVSARRGQMIAVAAVYVKNSELPPAAILMVFDYEGGLESAVALDPSREIVALELDDSSHIWTLTWGPGGKEPGESPVVVEYDRTGSTVGNFLNWSLFPPHTDSIQQNQRAGAASAGYDSDRFWFWLPVSTDMVVVDTKDGSVVNRTKTALPLLADHTLWPLHIMREPSGVVVGDFRVASIAPNAKAELGYFAWSPSTKTWCSFSPGACQGSRLVGMDRDSHIYFRFDNSSSICAYSNVSR